MTETTRTPCVDGFHWLGQSFATCDLCGQPAWEHAGMHTPAGLQPWKDGEAEACRAKWAPDAATPLLADDPAPARGTGTTGPQGAAEGDEDVPDVVRYAAYGAAWPGLPASMDAEEARRRSDAAAAVAYRSGIRHAAARYRAEVDRLRAQSESDVLEEIDERDEATAWADRLAQAIAPAEVIGEHASTNNPWARAVEAATEQRAELDRLRAKVDALAGIARMAGVREFERDQARAELDRLRAQLGGARAAREHVKGILAEERDQLRLTRNDCAATHAALRDERAAHEATRAELDRLRASAEFLLAERDKDVATAYRRLEGSEQTVVRLRTKRNNWRTAAYAERKRADKAVALAADLLGETTPAGCEPLEWLVPYFARLAELRTAAEEVRTDGLLGPLVPQDQHDDQHHHGDDHEAASAGQQEMPQPEGAHGGHRTGATQPAEEVQS